MELVVVRGGGDLATGIVQKLYRAGMPVLILEIETPLAIRRTVSLCEAVYDGKTEVEDVVCRHVKSDSEIHACLLAGEVPLLIDPAGEAIERLKPLAVVDAILAKKNLGTHREMAPITIGLGPGFEAGKDVDVAVETMRGHNLGRLIFQGCPLENTGIPGEIGGKGAARVIHAPVDGEVKHVKAIGDVVEQGEVIFYLNDTPVCAPFTGLLRGLIREGMFVEKGTKSADVDPRIDVDYHTISDKARCLGGAVLEAVLYLKCKNK